MHWEVRMSSILEIFLNAIRPSILGGGSLSSSSITRLLAVVACPLGLGVAALATIHDHDYR
jgi:hypothetical protein